MENSEEDGGFRWPLVSKDNSALKKFLLQIFPASSADTSRYQLKEIDRRHSFHEENTLKLELIFEFVSD